MNIIKYAKPLDEEALAAMTTAGNPSVSYLPGGFTHMRNMLMSLNPIKKQWGLEVLEKGGNYHINIEDALNIIVPKVAYEEFNTRVYNVIGRQYLNLGEMINEEIARDINTLLAQVNTLLLKKLTREKSTTQTLTLMEQWLRLFPNTRVVPLKTALLSFENYKQGIAKVIEQLRKIYQDDLGTLEMLVDALEEGKPLNMFEPFSEYQFIIGNRLETKFEGVGMVLELTVDQALMTVGLIYIDSKEVLAELEAYRTLRIAKQRVFPTGMTFKPTDFNAVKDTIEGMQT